MRQRWEPFALLYNVIGNISVVQHLSHFGFRHFYLERYSSKSFNPGIKIWRNISPHWILSKHVSIHHELWLLPIVGKRNIFRLLWIRNTSHWRTVIQLMRRRRHPTWIQITFWTIMTQRLLLKQLAIDCCNFI
jgi:hypothetical protein